MCQLRCPDQTIDKEALRALKDKLVKMGKITSISPTFMADIQNMAEDLCMEPQELACVAKEALQELLANDPCNLSYAETIQELDFMMSLPKGRL